MIVFSLRVPAIFVFREGSFKLKVRFDAEEELEFAIPTTLSQTYNTHLFHLTIFIEIVIAIQLGYALSDEKEIVDLSFVFDDDLSGFV